jgi:hypothetical protein
MNLRSTDEPGETFGMVPDQTAALRQMSREQLRLFGIRQVAYLKHGTRNSVPVFVLFRADGMALMAAESIDTALEAAVELGLDFVPVH